MKKSFKIWHCRTLFSLLSFEDIYITGTVFYHAGRIHLLLYAPHTRQNCQSLYTVIGQLYFFLVCWLPKPANLAFPSYTWYCTLGTGCRHDRFLYFCDWSNKFVLFLFLHALQHICYNLPCLAFHHFPVKLGVLGCILHEFWLLMCHSSMEGAARIMAPPPHRLRKHTDLGTHDCAHCPQL